MVLYRAKALKGILDGLNGRLRQEDNAKTKALDGCLKEKGEINVA